MATIEELDAQIAEKDAELVTLKGLAETAREGCLDAIAVALRPMVSGFADRTVENHPDVTLAAGGRLKEFSASLEALEADLRSTVDATIGEADLWQSAALPLGVQRTSSLAFRADPIPQRLCLPRAGGIHYAGSQLQ